MSPSSIQYPAVDGPGSVPPAGFTDPLTSPYLDTGGLRLHAVIGGDGPPRLLVHGWLHNWYAWPLLVPAPARDLQAIAPGMAASGEPQDGYDAGDLVALMDALAHQRSAMAGHDTGFGIAAAEWAKAVLYNGLGRYDVALAAAEQGGRHLDDLGLSPWCLVELIEAAVRTGEPARAAEALDRLSEMTTANGGDWALGVEARSRAMLSAGAAAERLYQEAIQRLARTTVRLELARAHLVYGEWLRRENRRVDAREQLRTAHELFTAMGTLAFADRTRRELLATGETVRKRTVESAGELTAQEALIARLAREGLSNPEIGTRLFLSPRTVEWHLRKVFTKLGISSRRQLRAEVLPAAGHQEGRLREGGWDTTGAAPVG